MAMSGDEGSMKYRVDAFREAMRELGYIEGKNLSMEYRYGDGATKEFPGIATEMVRLKPDVILVSSTSMADALKKSTSTIPIVVGSAGDLVGTGIVTSLAKPGGNVTGSTDMAPDLAAKRLELLREFVPKLERLGVVWGGGLSFSDEREFNEIQAAARKLGIAVQSVGSGRDPKNFQATYEALASQRADAIVIIQGVTTFRHNEALAQLALKNRLPAACEELRWVEKGCLISYGPDKTHSWRRAAALVDKILKGAKPADLPVEQPTKFELAVNMKSAKALGLTVPSTILVRATHVID